MNSGEWLEEMRERQLVRKELRKREEQIQRSWGRNEQKGSQGGWTTGKKKWRKMGLKKPRGTTAQPREKHLGFRMLWGP